MSSWDWYQFGEDIRKTVQNAVDSQDFNKLNQTISSTIESAVDGVGKSMKNVGSMVDEAAARAGHLQRGDGKSALKARKQELFERTSSTRAGGMALTIVGYVLAGGIVLTLLILGVIAIAFGGVNTGFQIAGGILLLFLLPGIIMAKLGTSMLGRTKRFRNYIRELQDREYCDVRRLAESIKKSPGFVKKDLRRMIERGWFRQGHLDNQGACLMVSDEAYRQYMQLQEQQKQMELQEKAEQHKASCPVTDENEPSQVQAAIAAGNKYVQRIRECNDAIPEVQISEKISRIELLVKRIFERVEQNPESVTDIRRLMEYYLPTTVKLLEAYKDLNAQPVQGENIISSKKEIEKTLDTLNLAFEKLLDSLFQDTAWDVSADISVLHTMLAQEGLTKDDFHTV